MHVSFDFDYTLADASAGAIDCANTALQALDLPPATPAKIRKTIGLSLERTFTALTGITSAARAAEFKQHFLVHADLVMLGHIRFYQGTRTVLELLRRDGHYVSIVSTKFRHRIEAALHRDALTHLIDNVVGGDCVTNNKPHPEALHLAMARSGVTARETIYVGDSATDGECASRANVLFIGLLSGTTSAGDLAAWRPLRIVDGIAALADVSLLSE